MNEHQESIISKIFMRITNNHSLCQLQQAQAIDIQEEEIRMTINLLYRTIAYTQISQNKIHSLH